MTRPDEDDDIGPMNTEPELDELLASITVERAIKDYADLKDPYSKRSGDE